MGVDLIGVIGHSLTKAQIIDLPNQINQWKELKDFCQKHDYNSYEDAHWDGRLTVTELELVWKYYQGIPIDMEQFGQINNIDANIDCWFGQLSAFENTILIYPSFFRYDNLRDPDIAKYILTISRMLAKRLGQQGIIYFPDAYYPTQNLEEKALEGLTIGEIKYYAINKYGMPPFDIDEARKYMFFIDHVEKSLSNITVWEGESPYWIYDEEEECYYLKKDRNE